MTYTFRCSMCDLVEEVHNVPVDRRNDRRDCPTDGCAGDFCRDEAETLQRGFGRRGGVAHHDDIITFMEKRYGNDPNFKPPASGQTNKGRGTPGGGRSFPGQDQKKWV